MFLERSADMRLETKIVLTFSMVALLGSVGNWAFYWGYLRTMPYVSTDFHQDLLGIRFIVCAGFLFCFIGFMSQRLWGKIVSIVSMLLILGFYVLWYFEKFRWIEIIGIRDGTAEYSNKLAEIGWFRDANSWDYVVLFAATMLLCWGTIQLKEKEYTNRKFVP